MGLYEPLSRGGGCRERAEDLEVVDKLKTTIIPMVDFDGDDGGGGGGVPAPAVGGARSWPDRRGGLLDPEGRGSDSVPEERDAELDAEAGLAASDPGQARIKELKLRNVPLATRAGVCGGPGRAALPRSRTARWTWCRVGGAEGEDR